MRKFLLLAIVLIVQSALWAAPVTQTRAAEVAERFAARHGADVNFEACRLEGLSHIYLFRDATGFVLVAGDDCVLPVLGYSFQNGFETNLMPEHIRLWLKDYDDQIAFNISHGIPASEDVHQAWYRLEHNQAGLRAAAPRAVRSVGPLLTTTWDQRPYYNDSCPTGCPAGCIAIAQTQIMRYWRHPLTGYGSHSYDNGSANFGATTYRWNDMPVELTARSTALQVSAVAQLVRHVGVAVEMNYGTSGSGAQDLSNGDIEAPSSENAYRNYFRYASSVRGVGYDDYGDAGWKALLRNELDAGRPIQYSGQSGDGGHAFVFDGYDSQFRFHVNWGWGGYCDGFYAVGQLNPAPGGTGGTATSQYNIDNEALIGIRPDTLSQAGATITLAVTGNNPAWGTASGGGSYTVYQDTVTLRAEAEPGYRFTGWSSGTAYNPFVFPASGVSRTDTALFEPVTGDTLYYCKNHTSHQFGFSGAPSITWGVRYVPLSLGGNKLLDRVALRTGGAGNYQIEIRQGGLTYPGSTVLALDTLAAQGNDWEELALSTPVAIDSTQSLWIIVTSEEGISYPVCTSNGMGQDDGYWYFSGNRWRLSPYYEGSAWQIKAIFSHAGQSRNVVITTVADATRGTVQGGGQYPIGSTVTLTATALPGYRFDHWQDGQTANPRTFTATTDAEYTATFVAEEYNIRVTVADGCAQMGRTTGSGTYHYGDVVEIEAIANPGYRFDHWQNGQTANLFILTVTGDAEYTATFAAEEYGVSVTVADRCAQMGHTTGSGTYHYGDVVEIEAIANQGYRFTTWQDGNHRNPRSVAITGDTVFVCQFEAIDALADAEEQQSQVYTEGRTAVVVIGTDEARVEIFASDGRRILATVQHEPRQGYPLPAAGVYVVKTDNLSHKITVY